jgi:hypothetical protein
VEPISKLLKEQGVQDVQIGDRNNHNHHHQLKTRICKDFGLCVLTSSSCESQF